MQWYWPLINNNNVIKINVKVNTYLQFKFVKYYFNWLDWSLLNYDKEEKEMHGKFNSLNVLEELTKI